ncbi:MAG TPA: endo-1,4-beta-xylanase [Terriglobales bacterium]
MPTRRDFLNAGLKTGAVCAAASLVPGCTEHHRLAAKTAPPTPPITGPGSLKAHAKAAGLYMGAAVSLHPLRTDPDYSRTIAEQCDMVVAETAMKWQTLRPAPDRYFFDDADELVAFADKHNMKVRGHNFVWHEAIPKWFESTVTKDNARQFLVDHIHTVAGRYRGKIHSWDVVNEAIDPKSGAPDGLRKSIWFELLGPDYLAIAFRAAREADPNALLTYNDYGIEYDNEEEGKKRDFILQLLRRLKSGNVPIDAVGIQSHIKAGSTSTIGKGLADYMASIRDMGLQLFLTELDVNEDDLPFDDLKQRDHAIAGVYRQFLDLTLRNASVEAVLTWGITDRYTWLNNIPTHKRKQPNRPQRSLPFDDDYRPTAAFFAMRESFDQRRGSKES